MVFFNLNDDEKEFARKKTKFCLVIYDIVSNKRRLKLAKLLEGYGVRVQRSCFELALEKLDFDCLVRGLRAFYQAEEGDNIIIYLGHKEDEAGTKVLDSLRQKVNTTARMFCSFKLLFLG